MTRVRAVTGDGKGAVATRVPRGHPVSLQAPTRVHGTRRGARKTSSNSLLLSRRLETNFRRQKDRKLRVGWKREVALTGWGRLSRDGPGPALCGAAYKSQADAAAGETVHVIVHGPPASPGTPPARRLPAHEIPPPTRPRRRVPRRHLVQSRLEPDGRDRGAGGF